MSLYSRRDTYTDADVQDHCYVNPFVGEGRYARYLKNWCAAGFEPTRQLSLVCCVAADACCVAANA